MLIHPKKPKKHPSDHVVVYMTPEGTDVLNSLKLIGYVYLLQFQVTVTHNIYLYPLHIVWTTMKAGLRV